MEEKDTLKKEEKDSKKKALVRKVLEHEYTPLFIVLLTIVIVMGIMFLFFRGVNQIGIEEPMIFGYSDGVEIRSSGPAGGHTVRMSFIVQTEEGYEKEIEKYRTIIQDLTIEKLLESDPEILQSKRGMDELREELMNEIEYRTGISIKGLFFREFLIN